MKEGKMVFPRQCFSEE